MNVTGTASIRAILNRAACMPDKIPAFVPPHKRTKEYARSRPGDPFYCRKPWRATRLSVLARDLWTCHYCCRQLYGDDATVDHVQARSEGGSEYDMANLVASCRTCNSRKGKKSV